MFGTSDRPVGIWLTLLVLGLGAMSTFLNVARSMNGGPNYTIGMSVLGLLAAGTSLWLCAEIWVRGPRIRTLATAVLVLVLLPYVLMLLSAVANGASRDVTTILILLGMMSAVYGSIALYLRRYGRALEGTP